MKVPRLPLTWRFTVAVWVLVLQRGSLAWRPSARSSSRQYTKLFQTKFRGRGLPYVETFEEQTTRRLWETNPFSIAKSIANTILQEGNEVPRDPLLAKVDVVGHQTNSSGYEPLFQTVYDSPPYPSKFAGLVAQNATNVKKLNFLLELAYRGEDFCGWQTQPNNDQLPSVQETIEGWLQELEGGNVDVRVCGRTDAGVHGIGQVARYRSRISDLSAAHVHEHLAEISRSSTRGLRCLRVVPVTKSFHPSFGAVCRAYVYLIDTDHWSGMDPSRVVIYLNEQLQSLQGQALDYIALSYGRLKTQTSICTLLHAQAHLVRESKSGKQAICVELVGDRFLRRMVRMLVENSLRIAVGRGARSEGLLLQHLASRDRRSSGNAAPADGLIFVGATFENQVWPQS